MSESWLRKATKNSDISIPNYSVIHCQTLWLQVIYKSLLGKVPHSQLTGHHSSTHP
jgi:hypothetical protein